MSETLSTRSLPNLDIGISLIIFVIHLSVQMEIDDPSPTHLMNLASKAACPITIAFHVVEELGGAAACIKSVCGEYLPFKNLSQREPELVRRHQPCFPSIARFNCLKSPKPMPPTCFGVANFFQEIQWRDLLSKELPRQYLVVKT